MFAANLSVFIVVGIVGSTISINSLASRRCLTTRLCQTTAITTADTTTTSLIGPPLSINEKFQGLQKIYNDPDVYIIENFLDEASCFDMIEKAKEKKLQLSPVAYAGWSTDVKDLLALAAKGPVTWLAILTAWLQTKDDNTATVYELVKHTLINFPIFYVIAALGISAFFKSRVDDLQTMRTSTSTTLDNIDNPTSGATLFVKQAAKLFIADDVTNTNTKGLPSQQMQKEAALFEAPTIIRYEPGQVLKPHYDANRDADTEDSNRGGQTLATLIVYLNDVEKGGRTRFGKLLSSKSTMANHRAGDKDESEPHLHVTPKRGDALLFFPADKYGKFDERLEHEGCPAVDEKWIARIWRHANRVQPPFGLTTNSLMKL